MQDEEIRGVLLLFYGLPGVAFGGSHLEAHDQVAKDAAIAHPGGREVSAPLQPCLFDRYSA